MSIRNTPEQNRIAAAVAEALDAWTRMNEEQQEKQ